MENLDLKENKPLDCFQIIAQCGQDRSKLYGIYNLAEIKQLFWAGKTRCDMHRDFSPKCFSYFKIKLNYFFRKTTSLK